MARIDDYKEALRLASKRIAQVNPHRISFLSGATCIQQGEDYPQIRLSLIDRDCLVRFKPEVEVLYSGGSEPVPIAEKILILHYLLTARGDAISGNLVTFREVPGGSFYYPAFLKRARDPLIRCFGAEPRRLLACAAKLGAEPVDLGDISFSLRALPRVPITVVLWGGDNEFPPEGNLLFDESISGYLPTEDIAVLSGMIVYRLIKTNQELL